MHWGGNLIYLASGSLVPIESTHAGAETTWVLAASDLAMFACCILVGGRMLRRPGRIAGGVQPSSVCVPPTIAAWYDVAVKQRVLFVRVAAGGTATLVAPSFGRSCVCCNADAMGRVQACEPSTEGLTATPVRMPVCLACEGHALQSDVAPGLQALLVTLGSLLCAVGAYYITRRPHDHFLWGMLAVSGAALVGGLLWARATARRNSRDQINGHHARLVFSIVRGRMLLDTSNEELVRELVARNPNARVLPEPLVWRWMRHRRLPAARVVRPSRHEP